MTVQHELPPSAWVCIICGRTRQHQLESDGWTVRENCDDCGVQFWWPLDRPSTGWCALHRSTTADWGDSLSKAWAPAVPVKAPLRCGRLLDVGCGHGLFLERVREQVGLAVWGFD